MCYYRGVKISNRDTLRLLEFEVDFSKYDIENLVVDGFAYGQTPVIISGDDCKGKIVLMEWGFIPHYITDRDGAARFRRGYKDDKGKFHPPITTLNAIGEELLLPGKMYRNAALNRRCLFISNCFYEWRHVFPLGKKGQPLKTAVKYPYCITTKDVGLLHFTAGIWQSWTDKLTGETVDTCALVTTKANELMQQVHNSKKRMPAILPEALAAEWISDGLSEERITEIATHQYPASDMQAWPILKDFKTALDPHAEFAYKDLPALASW